MRTSHSQKVSQQLRLQGLPRLCNLAVHDVTQRQLRLQIAMESRWSLPGEDTTADRLLRPTQGGLIRRADTKRRRFAFNTSLHVT